MTDRGAGSQTPPPSTDLIPPPELLMDGSASVEDFVRVGEGFTQTFLVGRARLNPDGRVLDLGCGNGSLARALTRVLSASGQYEGLDVDRRSIAWLDERYQGFDNFNFTHADLYNKWYNPSAQTHAAEYEFPYPAATFDVVVLKSVFTHMVPGDVRPYLGEISRVLKKGGRAICTFFLLNRESLGLSDQGGASIKLLFDYPGDQLARVADLEFPEKSIGHDELRLRAWGAAVGLWPVDTAYGDWCGRPSLVGLQDTMILVKDPSLALREQPPTADTDPGFESALDRMRLLEEHVAVMEGSTSWRVTAPLRALGRMARRLR